MSGKWTPGPWKAHSALLLVNPPKTEIRITDQDLCDVAIVRSDHRRTDAETSAIAHLITQSPELFDTLKELYADARELLVSATSFAGREDLTADDLEERGFAPDSFAKARAALAKAKGEGA